MRFIAFGLISFVLFGCSDSCVNTTKQDVRSPDGKYVATAFIRDCGATTDFSPQVHLRLAGENLAQTGNVFVGDHSDKIRLEWLSASHLVVYSDCAVVRQLTNFHGIVVEKRDSQ